MNLNHLSTHPFIRFDLDLTRIPPAVWALVGECASKLDHIAWSPLRSDTAHALEQIHLAKYIQGTVAIEGTHVSERQVKQQMGDASALAGSPEYDQAEIQNFVSALSVIRERMRSKKAPSRLVVTADHLCDLNRAVLSGTRTPEGINIGFFRHHLVRVHGYTPPHQDSIPPLVEAFCRWLEVNQWQPHAALADVHPLGLSIIRAILAHLFFELIHPFGDGNGRVGRLLELELLCDAGVPWPAALVLTNHYNLTKNDYFESLNQPRLSPDGTGAFRFLHYAVKGLRQGLDEQIAVIRKQVLDVSWHDLIYEMFQSGEHRAVITRQRKLALALSSADAATSSAKITDLNPDVARAYAGKSHRLLLRDLSKLQQMKIINRNDQGWIANKNLKLVFLPDRLSNPRA